MPEGLVKDGRIVKFDEDTVIRLVKDIVVKRDWFEVNFGAGITVMVSAKKN